MGSTSFKSFNNQISLIYKSLVLNLLGDLFKTKQDLNKKRRESLGRRGVRWIGEDARRKLISTYLSNPARVSKHKQF